MKRTHRGLTRDHLRALEPQQLDLQSILLILREQLVADGTAKNEITNKSKLPKTRQ